MLESPTTTEAEVLLASRGDRAVDVPPGERVDLGVVRLVPVSR